MTVNGTNLMAQHLSAHETTDVLDTSNFESTAGKAESTFGFTKVNYDGRLTWTVASDPFGTPGIYPRDDLASVDLYGNKTGGLVFSIPFSTVRSGGISAEARGQVTFDCQAESNGDYTRT
jgi:hypothetical protein